MRSLKSSLCILGLLVLAHPASASPTNHDETPPNWLAGSIASNRTLTAAAPGPNYFVYGDVTVQPGVTLTIQPGVTITFAADSDFLVSGTYPNRAELFVSGTLTALAPAGAPIRFETNSATLQWGGVTINAGGAGHFRNVTFDSAMTALRANAATDLDSCTINSSGVGMSLAANVTAHRVVVGDGTPTAVSVSTGLLTMSSSNLQGTTRTLESTGPATLNLTSCTLSGNGIVCGGASTLSMTGCSYSGSSSVIISTSGSFSATSTSLTSSAGSALSVTGTVLLTLQDVTIDATGGCGGGLYTLVAPNAQCSLRNVDIHGTNGANLSFATGTIRQLDVHGCAAAGSIGLFLGTGVTSPIDDSTLVSPTVIEGFATGVQCMGNPVRISNFLITGGNVGVNAAGWQLQMNYCTVSGSTTGVQTPGFNSWIRNSILNATSAITGASSCVSVAYTDLWPLADGLASQWCNGGQVASFNPSFVGAGPEPYRLASNSLFNDFSVSGREIGAYGPGPGPGTAGVGDPATVAGRVIVSPNPSREGRVWVRFSTASGGDVALETYDLFGRRVAVETLTGLTSGEHAIRMEHRLSKGIYWLRVRGPDLQSTRRLVVVD